MKSTMKEIKNNSIIICPNEIKPSLIKEIRKNNPFLNVKFISKNELLNAYFFDYDEKAIYYLHQKYNMSYQNADEILSNLKRIKIDDILNDNASLNINLPKLYNELKDNNLLIFDDLFKNLFINKSVYIIGYHKEDRDIHLLDDMGISYSYLNITNDDYEHDVYNFLGVEEELDYLFNNISKLIMGGVDPFKIFIFEIPSEYESGILKYANFYGLPINLDYSYQLVNSSSFNEFINSYKDNNDLIKAYNHIKNKGTKDVLKIADIIVKINNIKPNEEDIIDLIYFFAESVKVNYKVYKNGINIISSNDIIYDDEYVFMLGFNSSSYPKVYKDNGIINDNIKAKLNANTTIIKNKIEKDNLINFIKRTKNLFITYKLRFNSKECFKSSLINELNLNDKTGVIDNIRYSKKALDIEIAKYKDIAFNYNIKNEYYDYLSNEELGYRKYNNKYQKINRYNDKDLQFSYSALSNYFSCPFKYFVERVLKIGDFEELFVAKLGTICHQILEDSVKYKEPINLDKYQKMFDDFFKTNKERYYAKKLINQMPDVIKKNQEFEERYGFSSFAEEEIYVDINENTKLHGYIDKYMIDGANHAIIVDYKTGAGVHFDERELEYGGSLQLPIYDYMINTKFGFETIGIYIEHILEEDLDIDEAKKYLLEGVTTKDPELQKLITYDLKQAEASPFIKDVKINKDGEVVVKKGYSKGYKEEAEKRIIEANDKIRNYEFEIAPLIFGSGEGPCRYCDKKDICYKKKKDEKLIKLEVSEW